MGIPPEETEAEREITNGIQHTARRVKGTEEGPSTLRPEDEVSEAEASIRLERERETGGMESNKVAFFSTKAKEQLESGKVKAADSMEQAAHRLRDRAEAKGGLPHQAGTTVAEGIEGAAGYLRNHTTNEIWRDVEDYVRQHPGRALAGAIFTGYLLGKIMR
jgi:hypothetical protein